METNVVINNVSNLSKQRNLFLCLTIMLAISSVLLSLKLLNSDEKIILTPGLNQEVFISNSGVSQSYLEEVTMMYLPLLLDLTPETFDYKASTIMKYVSHSNSNYMQQLQKYFADAKDQYRKFSLSTSFAVKNLEVNAKEMQVIANGTLVSRYGQEGYNSMAASYQISYEWIGGYLRLKEFSKLQEVKK